MVNLFLKWNDYKTHLNVYIKIMVGEYVVYNNNVRESQSPFRFAKNSTELLIPNLWKPSHDALGSERYCLVSISHI
jgi:hypothetical protein